MTIATYRQPGSRLKAEITVTYTPLPPERRAAYEWAMRYLYGRLTKLARASEEEREKENAKENAKGNAKEIGKGRSAWNTATMNTPSRSKA